MKHKHSLIRAGALLAAALTFAFLCAGSAVAKSRQVNVRIEGLHKTLRAFKNVAIKGGRFTRQGEAINYATALGALDLATEENWQGVWSSQYSDWAITSVLGETHSFSSKYFWAIYVNDVQASSGADQIALAPGDDLVFAAIPDADYDEDLIGVTTAGPAVKGHSLQVEVVYYDASGKSHPLPGATVKLGKQTVKTNAAGMAKVTPRAKGLETVSASKTGYVRDETNRTVKA